MTVSTESGTRLYSEYEVDLLIEDLTAAAVEAIEEAAAESARAASLASLEREAETLREVHLLKGQVETLRTDNRRNTLFWGVIGLVSGFCIGVGGVLMIGGK